MDARSNPRAPDPASDASAIATPSHTNAVSAPVQIRNAGGTGIGSHGSTSSASGDSAIDVALASRRLTANTTSAARRASERKTMSIGRTPMRAPAGPRNAIVPLEIHAAMNAHAALAPAREREGAADVTMTGILHADPGRHHHSRARVPRRRGGGRRAPHGDVR